MNLGYFLNRIQKALTIKEKKNLLNQSTFKLNGKSNRMSTVYPF